MSPHEEYVSPSLRAERRAAHHSMEASNLYRIARELRDTARACYHWPEMRAKLRKHAVAADSRRKRLMKKPGKYDLRPGEDEDSL